MQFSLKKLLATVTACSVFFAIIYTAGFWIAIGILLFILLLRWAIVTPRKKFWILLRLSCGVVSLIAVWFLAVDWSWFVWDCTDCRTGKEIDEYRILGLTVKRRTEDYVSIYDSVLKDLGTPCSHANTTYWHKHRHWGLVLCACPCWNGIHRLSGGNSIYSKSIQSSVREIGRNDPEFAKEVYRQVITLHNHGFVWDAFLSDEIVNNCLKESSAIEALSWIDTATSSELRVIESNGDIYTEPLSFIEELYQLGASEVFVAYIENYKLDKVNDGVYVKDGYYRLKVPQAEKSCFDILDVQDAQMIAVRLPASGKERDCIFSWDTKYQKKIGEEPTKDYGQSYLLLHAP